MGRARNRFIPPAQDTGYHADNADQRGAYAGDYADDDDYDEERAPRRSGTVVIVALLGLAVLGTAGALGYRGVHSDRFEEKFGRMNMRVENRWLRRWKGSWTGMSSVACES